MRLSYQDHGVVITQMCLYGYTFQVDPLQHVLLYICVVSFASRRAHKCHMATCSCYRARKSLNRCQNTMKPRHLAKTTAAPPVSYMVSPALVGFELTAVHVGRQMIERPLTLPFNSLYNIM